MITGSENPAAQQLVSFVLPIMVFYFVIGFLITILYHLSLYFIDGEYRDPDELLLDLMTTAVRVPLYFFAWPVVLYFDRTVLYKIRLFWRWLEPKNREEDAELKEALAQARLYQTVRNNVHQKAGWVKRRQEELRTGAERQRRLRRLSSDNKELAKIWLLAGIGRGSDGAEVLVFRYPEAVLPEEFDELVRNEVRVYRQWRCLRCGTEVEPKRIVLPEPFYLEVVENEKPLVAGWAYEGSFRQEFAPCLKCGAELPAHQESLTIFGSASEVVSAIHRGLSFLPAEQESIFSRIMFIRARGPVMVVVGLLGLMAVLLILGVCIWAVYLLIWYFRTFGTV